MNAKELRIGNWVLNHRNREVEVEQIRSCNIQANNLFSDIGEMKPIPLTENWLKKFGFRKIKDDNYAINYSNYVHDEKTLIIRDPSRTDKNSTWGATLQGGDLDSVNLRVFEYVHQLQNLYFALTGKELLTKVNA